MSQIDGSEPFGQGRASCEVKVLSGKQWTVGRKGKCIERLRVLHGSRQWP